MATRLLLLAGLSFIAPVGGSSGRSSGSLRSWAGRRTAPEVLPLLFRGRTGEGGHILCDTHVYSVIHASQDLIQVVIGASQDLIQVLNGAPRILARLQTYTYKTIVRQS